MANYLATDTDLTSVATAIRTKGGTSARLMFPSGFVSAIQAIPTGGESVDYFNRPKINDGNAYLYLYLPNDDDLQVTVYISVNSQSQITVDWGDGSTVESFTDVYSIDHTYARTGYYTVAISKSGSSVLGNTSGNTWLLGGGTYPNRVSNTKLIGMEFGTFTYNDAELLNGSNCAFLYSKEASPIRTGSVQARECNMLHTLEISEDATEIKNYAYYYDRSLRKVVIPSSIVTINNQAFQGCYNVEFHMEATTPPTLSNSNAFTYNTTFYVPYSADHSILDAYKTATNWSTFAENIFEEDA